MPLESFKKFYKRWLSHQKKIKASKPLVDNHPPPYSAHNALNPTKLRRDRDNMVNRLHENMEMYIKVNKIQRNVGTLFEDLMRSSGQKSMSSYVRKSRQQTAVIEKRNMELGKKVCNAKPQVDCWHVNFCDFEIKVVEDKIDRDSLVGHWLDDNYKMPIPEEIQPRKIMRPTVWLDVDVKRMQPLGKVYIELYLEACPQIVLDIVAACARGEAWRFQITHLFADLFLGMHFKMPDQNIYDCELQTEVLSFLHHEDGPGIISCPRCYVEGTRKNRDDNLQLTLSFRALSLKSNDRVIFGRILKPEYAFLDIKGYGSKLGKPTRIISVINCGLKD